MTFMIDSSGSVCDNDVTGKRNTEDGFVTCDNWEYMLEFFEVIARFGLDVGINKTRVAAVRFATTATLLWDLNT